MMIRWSLIGVIVLALGVVPLQRVRANGKPDVDVVYANGTTAYMIAPHLDTNPSPGLRNAPPLYVLVFPVVKLGICTSTALATGTCGSIALPSGYQPQCDPCFHPGLPLTVSYHDHILAGSPGLGTNGTAGSYRGPWHIYLMMYSPTYAESSNFAPIKDDEDIPAAIEAGDFLPAFNGSYMLDTGHVVICPLVSANA